MCAYSPSAPPTDTNTQTHTRDTRDGQLGRTRTAVPLLVLVLLPLLDELGQGPHGKRVDVRAANVVEVDEQQRGVTAAIIGTAPPGIVRLAQKGEKRWRQPARTGAGETLAEE